MSYVVTYKYEFNQNNTDDSAIEVLLTLALAVTSFDVGLGVLWFKGKPGAELRKVRDAVKGMLK